MYGRRHCAAEGACAGGLVNVVDQDVDITSIFITPFTILARPAGAAYLQRCPAARDINIANYAADAEQGSTRSWWEPSLPELFVPQGLCGDTREAQGKVGANFYGHPAENSG